MENLTVSIFIPTYNQAAYIIQSVESALSQNYSSLEIIVSNDNSTDNTEEILHKYINSYKIKYFKNNVNLGRVANYRKCLYEYATGDWIINLDGDDYFINSNFITFGINEIVKGDVDNILFFQGSHIYKGLDFEKGIEPNISAETIKLNAGAYVDKFFSVRHFSHMSTIYNRKLAMHIGFYERDVISSDIYSLLKMAVKYPDKKVILSKYISGVWRQHNNNTTKSFILSKHLKNFKIYTSLFALRNNSAILMLKNSLWFIKAIWVYWGSYFANIVKNK